MARNFGVEKEEYIKALEEIRKIELPESYWASLLTLINNEDIKAAKSAKDTQVSYDEMHREFTI